MDYGLTFVAGILTGWLMTWFWFATRGRWRQSKELRAAAAKTRKENAERAAKAKQQQRTAYGEAVRTVVEVIIVIAVIGAATWFLWAFARG